MKRREKAAMIQLILMGAVCGLLLGLGAVIFQSYRHAASGEFRHDIWRMQRK